MRPPATLRPVGRTGGEDARSDGAVDRKTYRPIRSQISDMGEEQGNPVDEDASSGDSGRSRREGGIGALLGLGGFAGTARAADGSGVVTADGGLELDGDLEGLLRRNELWTAALPDDYFADVQTGQDPTVTTVCCADSRVSQEGMFLGFFEAGFLFKPSNIGNRVVSVVDGERVVDGDFLYGLENADSEHGAVVGHTDCGAVTAAYERATGATLDQPPGIDQKLEVLVDVVEDGLDSDRVDTDAPKSEVVNRLVEYNVNRQVEFLVESDEVSDHRDLYGFVYDFQGAYGGPRGRTYLVNVDGETDPSALREAVPDDDAEFVRSLLR